MAELSEKMFPKSDIEAHLKLLRRMQPQTDPAKQAKAEPRALATAPAYCTLATAVADFIDAYRVNGYSAGEAVQAIWEHMLDPIADAPVIKTS